MFAVLNKSIIFANEIKTRTKMKQNITKKGLDANFNEIAVIVKYDSMGVNQGTFYKDIEGEHEMSERMANLLFEENVCIR